MLLLSPIWLQMIKVEIGMSIQLRLIAHPTDFSQYIIRIYQLLIIVKVLVGSVELNKEMRRSHYLQKAVVFLAHWPGTKQLSGPAAT